MLSLTLLLLAPTALIFSKRLLGDYFSPPAVYTFFWAFSIGVLELGWVSYDPMRERVWGVIIASYASFMGGCLIVTLYGFIRPAWLNAEPHFAHLDRHKLERALLVLFVIGIFGYLVQLANINAQIGFSTYLDDPSRAREVHSNVKYLGFFNILNVANFVLAVAYLVLYRKPHKWVYLILFWAVASTLLTTDRTRFFYLVIWAFYVVVFLYRRVDLSPRLILAGAMTLLVLLLFFLTVARVYKKEALDDNMEYVNIPSQFGAMVDPYIYLTGSFPVLQAFLEDKQDLAYGKYSFGPLVKLVELVYPEFERVSLTGKFYRVPIELNACTYLELFYKDFGFLGIVLGPLFLGVLCMTAYLAMRGRKTLFSVFFVSLLSFCITISIFVNHFSQIATWYFVGVGYIVHRYCFSAEPKPQDDLRKHIFG